MRSSYGLKPEEVDDWIGEMLEETRPHRDAIKREFAAEQAARREQKMRAKKPRAGWSQWMRDNIPAETLAEEDRKIEAVMPAALDGLEAHNRRLRRTG